MKVENKVLCPVCGASRERPKLTLPLRSIIFISIGWSSLLMILFVYFWGGFFGVSIGMLFGVLCFLALEVYYSGKFKRELVCPVCQFDPLLFKRSPQEAEKRCRESLEKRDSAFLERWHGLRRIEKVGES